MKRTQTPILQTHALAIGYKASRQPAITIAQDLSLHMQRGQLVGLLGPNGAGKSTLMRTIAGMQKPLQGQILLNGADVHQIPAHDLAQHMSIVLTDRPNLGLLNGYALVALGRHPYTNWMGQLSEHDEDVVRWAVEAVGAEDLADKPVMELSDGQRQKLMIARALAQETELILLDEPTAYLDLPRRVEIMALLRHLAHDTGRAILISTHDLDLALRSADRLWLMSGGTIHTGTPEDLVLNGAFEAAFQSEGIAFDRQTGTFSLGTAPHTAVYVGGDGIAATWTRRALERAGYQLATESSASQAIITVTDTLTDGPCWHLHLADETYDVTSIDALLNTLQAHISSDR
ncbi:ABC transporter ATP-binding protein [Phototrophicus methaneseepsis]|uniref:ABC transporter ATP-binding protein n=1 Tax=Phototrophicus methaneseepsis TaxID=2710758 RepID=A0A7S8E8J4_9CHLR|nr:ABC transporter ATP-binding protein [Phototrophicus methaneseepsis]QPC82253.1 ABC transporter ATP-binding protein [Phototrophicus methaneseepsis]